MEVTPRLITCEFAELDPGDLFTLRRGSTSYAALAVKDPKSVKEPNANDNMALILGPASSDAPNVPMLMNLSPQTRVISFAKDYTLRLPADPKAWLTIRPPEESYCLVLNADKLFMRAQVRGDYDVSQWYVDIKTGLLLTDSSGNFSKPSGDCAYTLEWTFETTETETRVIVASPCPNKRAGSGTIDA